MKAGKEHRVPLSTLIFHILAAETVRLAKPIPDRDQIKSHLLCGRTDLLRMVTIFGEPKIRALAFVISASPGFTLRRTKALMS
jgi:hypothetical protein